MAAASATPEKPPLRIVVYSYYSPDQIGTSSEGVWDILYDLNGLEVANQYTAGAFTRHDPILLKAAEEARTREFWHRDVMCDIIEFPGRTTDDAYCIVQPLRPTYLVCCRLRETVIFKDQVRWSDDRS